MISETPYLAVLGIAQDAGYPAAGCRGPCCARAWEDPRLQRNVSCLGIADPRSNERWLIDCTPDFPQQLRMLDLIAPPADSPGLSGILLTHAHMGHYTGLLQLGREALGACRMAVYAMPRLREFLTHNSPWSQLVAGGHIELRDLADETPLRLSDRTTVTPLLVPHRDEFSETVGFRIEGPVRSAVYLPDIDKWERWELKIEDVIAAADVAYLDGTLFTADELSGRNMAEIPHPLVTESIERFAVLPATERGKVRFIHLNHTNPLLDPSSDAARAVERAGCRIASEGERFEL